MAASNGLNKLSRQDKEAYIRAIKSGNIKSPRYFYPSVILYNHNTRKTDFGENIDEIRHPYETIIILPKNGRETA